jgi:hypothetical protein
MYRRVLIGSGFIVGGPALLLVTTGLVPLGNMVLPVAIVVVGFLSLYRAFQPDGREAYVFSGTFLTLFGVFLVLQQSVLTRRELTSIWPVFMTFGGLSLVAYGFRKGRHHHLSMVVPGSAITAISFVFLLFSLGVIEASLVSLTARWWPLLLIPLGLFVLLAGSADAENNGGADAPESDDPDGEDPGEIP